jgi:hypothetical protein
LSPQPMTGERDIEQRRAAARRTAVWLALLATGIFVAFILAGVLGR